MGRLARIMTFVTKVWFSGKGFRGRELIRVKYGSPIQTVMCWVRGTVGDGVRLEGAPFRLVAVPLFLFCTPSPTPIPYLTHSHPFTPHTLPPSHSIPHFPSSTDLRPSSHPSRTLPSHLIPHSHPLPLPIRPLPHTIFPPHSLPLLPSVTICPVLAYREISVPGSIPAPPSVCSSSLELGLVSWEPFDRFYWIYNPSGQMTCVSITCTTEASFDPCVWRGTWPSSPLSLLQGLPPACMVI